MIGTNTLTQADAGVRESGRMDRLLDKEFETPADERILVQSATLTDLDPSSRRRSATSPRRSKPGRTVTNFTSPLEDHGLISADRHSALIDFEMKATPTRRKIACSRSRHDRCGARPRIPTS